MKKQSQLMKATQCGEVMLRAFCLCVSWIFWPYVLGQAAASVALWPLQQANMSLFCGMKWLQATCCWSPSGAVAESSTAVLFPQSWPGVGICCSKCSPVW